MTAAHTPTSIECAGGLYTTANDMARGRDRPDRGALRLARYCRQQSERDFADPGRPDRYEACWPAFVTKHLESAHQVAVIAATSGPGAVLTSAPRPPSTPPVFGDKFHRFHMLRELASPTDCDIRDPPDRIWP